MAKNFRRRSLRLSALQRSQAGKFGWLVSISRDLGIGRRSLMAFCTAFFPIHGCPRCRPVPSAFSVKNRHILNITWHGLIPDLCPVARDPEHFVFRAMHSPPNHVINMSYGRNLPIFYKFEPHTIYTIGKVNKR